MVSTDGGLLKPRLDDPFSGKIEKACCKKIHKLTRSMNIVIHVKESVTLSLRFVFGISIRDDLNNKERETEKSQIIRKLLMKPIFNYLKRHKMELKGHEWSNRSFKFLTKHFYDQLISPRKIYMKVLKTLLLVAAILAIPALVQAQPSHNICKHSA